ncbi:MAG: ATP-binding protein [Planctomycetota bacterium]
MTELLLDTGLDGQQEEFARASIASAVSLLEIINDLLDFSKIQAEGLVLHHDPFDLWTLVENVTELCAVRAHNMVEVGCLLDRDVPRHVRGDALRVRQILVNLIGNAVKFTLAGEVRVTVTGKLDDEGTPRISVEVKDTGPGIPAECHQAIFEPFRQVDNSSTRQHGGSGLGLAISQNIAAALNGRLSVASEPGLGSTFTLEFPLERDPAGAVERHAPPVGPFLLWAPPTIASDALRLQFEGLGLHLNYNPGFPVPSEVLTRFWSDHGTKGTVLVDGRQWGREQMHAFRDAVAGAAFGQVDVVMLRDRLTVRDGTGDGLYRVLRTPLRATEFQSFLADAKCQAPAPTLPAMPAGPNAGLAARGAEYGLQGLRLLVAEDNPTNQEVLRKMLERLGCAVTLVGNGAAALEIFQRRPFDIVLLDCQMPVMDGMQAAMAMREVEAGKTRMPILLLTAHSPAEVGDKLREADLDGLIQKPIHTGELVRCLQSFAPDRRDQAA